MREILFRAKRDKNYCDTQEWTYGVPFIDHEGDCIFKTASSERVVDPKTVGQYTGLTVNGTRIFEGDIVKFGNIIGIINYSTGCYCVKTNKPDWRNRNNPAIDIVINEYPNEIEIIGNIHDNPELLVGREKHEDH
ncbi:MAG: hypothetical protein IIU63_00405 [Clostridia bacterium]|nr:hypothetical protein [Clostridia bacterium]